ncbi:hypothetical protein FMEAI12_6610002 [Parafrankia sp. Ea1.12]|nr:hypothetical protein FMEAI12_6610002 [Parafrankia sp. Ea1.12]
MAKYAASLSKVERITAYGVNSITSPGNRPAAGAPFSAGRTSEQSSWVPSPAGTFTEVRVESNVAGRVYDHHALVAADSGAVSVGRGPLADTAVLSGDDAEHAVIAIATAASTGQKRPRPRDRRNLPRLGDTTCPALTVAPRSTPSAPSRGAGWACDGPSC